MNSYFPLGVSSPISIKKGQVTGVEAWDKFGRNSAVTTAEDVWDGGGIYTGFPTTSETLEIFSSSTSDNGYAEGTLTCVSAIATNTVTVNGLVYTAVAGAKSDNTEFSVDVSDNACAADLKDSIENDVRVGVTEPTAVVQVSVATNVVTVFVEGTVGNTVDISSTGGTITASAATLADQGTGAWTVKISNLLDANFNEMDDVTLTLRGTTAVSLGTGVYHRASRVQVMTAGSGNANAGTLTLRHTSTTANIFAKVEVGANQSLVCCYTVPAGKSLYINNLSAIGTRAAGAAGSVTGSFRVNASVDSDVFQTKRSFELTDSMSYNDTHAIPLEVTEKRDIKMRIDAVNAGTVLVIADMEGVLLDN